jgi:diguanylate cyclase (GGDEF)-like protein
MARINAQRIPQNVLVIGDTDRDLAAAVAQAMPGAAVHHAENLFDGIAELSRDRYSAVFAAAEPVGRRPEAAMRTLRELTADGRLVLFGNAGHEPLSRKLMEHGCDDYLVTPVTAQQVLQSLTSEKAAAPEKEETRPLRMHTDYDGPPPAANAEKKQTRALPTTKQSAAGAILAKVPVGEMILDAILEHPGDAVGQAVAQINARLFGGSETYRDGAGLMQLSFVAAKSGAAFRAAAGQLTYMLQASGGTLGTLVLNVPAAQESLGQSLLAEIGPLLAKAAAIQHRSTRLQKLAFTDDLTGLYNCRYFKHFLGRTLADAKRNRFPVTLFLFDIDNFKSYNDRFGHAVGDDILKQAANLMRRCVRDHDLVARIGGDEFAVIFWEKEGPRVVRDSHAGVSGRPPSEPQQILARFRRMLELQEYPLLGSTGRGTLTISGGLAVYPYDAPDMQSLIDAADKALMFGAKKSGRNTIQIVGNGNTPGA